MNTSALKKFLTELKRQKGVTQKKIADDLGLQQGVVSEMINGKRNADRLVAYLMMTYGYKAQQEVHLVEEQEKKHYTTNSNGIKFYEQEDASLLMEVPKVKYSALGSPEDEYATLLQISEEDEKALFPADKVYHGKYYAFEVDGDSMDDGTRKSFERGDLVLVRELDRDDWKPKLHLEKWNFWVVCWDNNVRLKQIVKQEDNIVTLHSLNPCPEYTDFQLDLNKVYRLFNVIEKAPKKVRYENR